MDPIHQFSISRLVPLHLFGYDVSFTNSAAFMLAAVLLISALMVLGVSRSAVVPGRVQSMAEISYEFVAGMVREAAGNSGMAFFPFVFTIFMFVLLCNLLGFIPYFFTVTSHIIITISLALLVFLTVVITGFVKNGSRFLKLFVPAGVPIYIMPLVVAIEVVSFLSRPVSHSVRLFANMLAGHITVSVFGSFVVMLLGAGGWAFLSPLPFVFNVGLLALDLLVAFLQAYVFAMLTCMYINDALHPVH